MELKGLYHNDDAVQPFWDEFMSPTYWLHTQWAMFGDENGKALLWVKDLGDVDE